MLGYCTIVDYGNPVFLLIYDTDWEIQGGVTVDCESAIIAYSKLTHYLPIHSGKGGIIRMGGYCKVLYPLSSANDPKTFIKRLRIKGVRMRNIMFLGFLKVKMRFL